MAFTYDPTTAVGRARLKIGDTIENEGPRPHPTNTNFSDEEIAIFLEDGDGAAMAAALACETLANEWNAIPMTKLGPHQEDTRWMVQNWQQRAKDLRDEAVAGQSKGFSVVTGPRALEQL
jgi:hypothetical protein